MSEPRRPFIAGNWKMNMDAGSARDLAGELASAAGGFGDVDVAVCPPYPYLSAVRETIGDATIGLGAQDVYHESGGAFTGEVSTAMLLDVGCRYVILGHSERRNVMGESDAQVNQKLVAALAAGLCPIVCVGELLQQREAGQTADVIRGQFDGSLAGLTPDEAGRIVIAYEPVWAIGTGKVATPEQAEEVHADLRTLLEQRYNADVAAAVRIQYGGSVKAENAASLLGQPNIDGALVGGASLKASAFLPIIEAARSWGR